MRMQTSLVVSCVEPWRRGSRLWANKNDNGGAEPRATDHAWSTVGHSERYLPEMPEQFASTPKAQSDDELVDLTE